ncbi:MULTISPECIES: GTP 3',8-cyclase MoaA [Microbacterium]|uniref:GTP 3',8-cyclase MoaA n=1 Tax=Microbacterium TaxID=33882 RepID=UPI0006FFC278|nr:MULTISPECIES: GTP 3',8-cyclase MoaA [unclassified Microbacterium]MBN9198192.1 GTP 3',8-cyclase MoaA [Microbacterium ginsengisoli]MCK9915405.1 GTP 3',8-cyclase MoaA [Microbacteriaceae bacterium K1510]KQR94139.1 cyclic pyranopterin phosphate synthase MoaA [Microbacterium sp. Leaf347]KQR97030.1 cyclic pyranopterin phosphate synthase MoaA [Microbacterium sp. Leaf351]OJU78360.1 MAG: cyclic pyranopterin phosphate synthase [Microbacterium sp. 71-23]
MIAPLVDTHGRVHSDLRISLTDRCSLRCTYCMPEQGNEWLARESILTVDEIVQVATVAVAAGVNTLRLTGGEPLLRRDLAEIVSRLSVLEGPGGPVEVAMTTNGIGLDRRLPELIDAGLARVNISLDTLRRDRFAALTRRDRLDEVLAGVRGAAASALAPVKLNAVAMRGVNDDELVELVEFALSIRAELRFIEQMPLDVSHTWDRAQLVTREEILAALGERWRLVPAGEREHAPAERFLLEGGPASVGVIASVTAPFCAGCDRLRLTADGQLRNCLFSRSEYDLVPVLRGGAVGDIDEVLRACVAGKRRSHGIDEPGFVQPQRGMNAIGG